MGDTSCIHGHAFRVPGSSLNGLIENPQGACGAAATLLNCEMGRLTSITRIRSAISITFQTKRGESTPRTHWRIASRSEVRIRRWYCEKSEVSGRIGTCL